MTKRQSPRLPVRTAPRKRSEVAKLGDTFDPIVSAAAREFLAVPPLIPALLIADPAQEEARHAVRTADTIFIAPTGYGKSWVAYEAAGDVLDSGGQVYYTTPLKALSNQKFVDLSERFGPEQVGLITGDRRENPGAAIIVLTTEILRAMLLAGDALASAYSRCLVVLDECHWLADPERGTTWEEVILLAPRSARLLLLSANVGNGAQITGWLEAVRGHEPRLLTVETRAVPQRWGIWHNGSILPLGEAIAKNLASGLSPNWPTVVEVLKRDGLTPALVFLPTRRACDALADQCASVEGLVVRSHHGGMTLANRLRIERDLQAGAIDAVFCTTTLASGIDAPVKSVVFGALNDGQGRPLSPSVIQQMAGRAGRRGRDSVGFVVAVASTSRDLNLIEVIRTLPPQPIDSAFEASYQTVLRLVVQRGLDGILDLASRSFASFQNRDLIASLKTLVARDSSDLENLQARLQPRSCADPAVTWPRYVAAEIAFSKSQSPRDAERLRSGYLCTQGIAFARNPRKSSRVLILSPGGALEERSHAPLPLASREEVEAEVHDIVRSLLDTPTDLPVVGRWFAFGSLDGGRSIERVVEVRGDRVSFGGEGTYAFARLTGKRVHALDPARFGPRVAALLAAAAEQSIESDAKAVLKSELIPCPTCPAFERCPGLSASIRGAREGLVLVRDGLWRSDPEARVTRIAGALEKLGALDARRRPTELGRALLATFDRAGLFFAFSREQLGRLSPERLALVVAATRDIRLGRGPAPTGLLPAFYVDLVAKAAEAEVSADGIDALATLNRDAERPVDPKLARVRVPSRFRPAPEDDGEDADDGTTTIHDVNRPSFADRRAYVFGLLWSGRPIDTVGIAPGDAERLFLDVIATLDDLREIPELRESAHGAIVHLRAIADSVLAAKS